MATTLWAKTGCRYCDELRQELIGARVSFVEIDVERSPHLVPELLKLTDRVRIVPVLVSGTCVRIAPRGGTTF